MTTGLDKKINKELTTCKECNYAYLNFLLHPAKWTGEECKICKVKRLDLLRRRYKRECYHRDCKVHKKGRYAVIPSEGLV